MSSAPTGLEVAAQRPGGGSVKKWLWIAAGAVLMALAVWMALRSGGMERAVASLRDASPLVVAALLVLPAASWLLTSTLFWALTRRFGRVRWPEMCALIGASWLLNNLPLRPGMVGRVTYHRLVNEIPVLASVRVMVEALLCSALAGAVAVAVLAVASGEVAIGGAVMAFGVVGAGVALALLRRRGTPLPVGLLALGTGIRVADIAGWVVRYWLLLRLAGAPVSPMEAMGVTIASMLASMTPVQFGLREWAVGAAASLTGRSGAGGTMLSAGVSADVLNRGIELMLAIPIGLGAAWVISRRVRASRTAREGLPARREGF